MVWTIEKLQLPDVSSVWEEQLDDATPGPILRDKEAGHKLSTDSDCVSCMSYLLTPKDLDQLIECDGVFCWQFEAPDGRSAVIQAVVPLGDHLGVEKTLARLQEHFNWHG